MGSFDPVPALVATGRALLAVPAWARGLLPLGWIGVIWLLSDHQPGGGRPPFPGWGLVLNTGHAFLYGVLALLCVPLLPRRDGWVCLTLPGALAVLGMAVGYGAFDEWHQSWVEGRVASGWDLLTDAVGAAATLATVAALGPRPWAEERRVPVVRTLWIGFAACWLVGGLSTLVDAF